MRLLHCLSNARLISFAMTQQLTFSCFENKLADRTQQKIHQQNFACVRLGARVRKSYSSRVIRITTVGAKKIFTSYKSRKHIYKSNV